MAGTYSLICLVAVELKRTCGEDANAVDTVSLEVSTDAFFANDLLERLNDSRVDRRLSLRLEDNLDSL